MSVFKSSYEIDKKHFNRLLMRFSLPIALQSLMLASVAAADAFMLGRVAQNEMTAVSLATQVQFVQNMFLGAITTAGAILGAQYYGKGDKHTLRDIFNICLKYAGFVSIIFFILCELTPEYLMLAFTSDAELIVIGSSYLKIAGWSYLITGISQCYLTMMKITDHVREGAMISSVAVVSNIVLNALLIFGLLEFTPMRSRGAAIATTVSRIVELGLCLFISAGKDHIRPVLSRLVSTSRRLRKDYIRQCMPLMGGALCWGVGFTSYTAIIGHMGTDAAAANSIAAVVRDLICCVCNGIGSAAGIMVGNELGSGDLEKGKAYGIRLRNISFLIGFLSTAFVLVITPMIVRSVILTDEAREFLTGMMIIMAIYMIGRCVNTVTINGILNGGGDTLFDFYSLIVCMWLIAIPLALIGAFVLNWPVLLVYSCTCLDEVGKIPWVMI